MMKTEKKKLSDYLDQETIDFHNKLIFASDDDLKDMEMSERTYFIHFDPNNIQTQLFFELQDAICSKNKISEKEATKKAYQILGMDLDDDERYIYGCLKEDLEENWSKIKTKKFSQ